MKTEILYGIHPVCEAFKAARRTILEVYISSSRKPEGKISRIIEGLGLKKIPLKKVPSDTLKSLTGTETHQGIAAKVSRLPLPGPEALYRFIQDDSRKFLLLLDNVVDPHNLGALIRTAVCVGIQGVVFTKDRSAAPTPAVSKGSAGALEHASLFRVTNMVNTIRELKNKKLWVMGMDRDAGKSVFESDLSGPVAIVIGGEERGIRPLVKKHCDFMFSIPQTGKINSLNASVAGAIVMYEAFRQRAR